MTSSGVAEPAVPSGRVKRRQAWGLFVRVAGSTWTLGLLAALASWNIVFLDPAVGLDPSWIAGLYMAAHRGLHFGSQLVFTYGPLGFLATPSLWYSGLGVVSWLFSGALYLGLAISLVWALRRTLPGPVAAVVTAVLLLATPDIVVSIALTAVWCLMALAPDSPSLASGLVLYGGAVLGAAEALIVLRSGPVILVMCAITVAAQDGWRRRLPLFIGCSAAVFIALWFASGQAVSNFPDFVRGASQIVSGYSDAMGVPAPSPVTLPVAILVSIALVAGAALSAAPGRRRLAAALVIAAQSFVLYKEAVVRADSLHSTIFFETSAVIGAALLFGKRRVLVCGAIAVLGVIAIAENPFPAALDFNPVTHARAAGRQVQLVLSPARRAHVASLGTLVLAIHYGVSDATLRLLSGHTVHIDPWEAGVAWSYHLRWDPLPVFQEYSAYTPALDRLNANALRSPTAPQRILRENTTVVDPYHVPATIDSRVPQWDAPATHLAMLCNYVQLRADRRWQVLGKVPNRCGAADNVGSIQARYGETITIPPAKAGGVLYAKVYGFEVSGFERIRALLYRARFRYVQLNGGAINRFVPDTASDGLIMAAAPRVDYPAPYAISPDVRTIKFIGGSGRLRIDLYWMPVS